MPLSYMIEPNDRDWIIDADMRLICETIKVDEKTEKQGITQVLGLQTMHATYFLICDVPNSLRNPEVLAEMEKKGDTHVLRMVCITDGCPDLAPPLLLQTVYDLNKANKDTQMLITALKKYPLHTHIH